jgi:hypothetical protein
MIRLQISAAAFAAICASLPGSVNVENERAPNGDAFVRLDHATVAKLRYLRGPGAGQDRRQNGKAPRARFGNGQSNEASPYQSAFGLLDEP